MELAPVFDTASSDGKNVGCAVDEVWFSHLDQLPDLLLDHRVPTAKAVGSG